MAFHFGLSCQQFFELFVESIFNKFAVWFVLKMPSGRYWANISDTVLTGEFRQWSEGEMYASVHLPGTFFTVFIIFSG